MPMEDKRNYIRENENFKKVKRGIKI